MSNLTSGIVLIAIGGAAIIFRKWFIRESLDAQNRMFGFRYGKNSTKLNNMLAPIMGLIFIICGILVMLGVKF
jgi:hypothetical protein